MSERDAEPVKTPAPEPEPLAPGEYVDLTLSIGKWREVIGSTRWRSLRTVPRPVWILLGILLGTLGATQLAALFFQGFTWGAFQSVGLPLTVWLLWFVSFSFSFVGEPWARFVRYYGAAGRLDIVSFGQVTSYTRETHTLGDPKFMKPTPGVLELRGPGYTQRVIRLAPRDAETLRRLWELPEIAPPYGGDPDG